MKRADMMEMAVDKEEVEERRGEKFEKINKNWGDKERSMLRQMAKRKMSPSQTMIAFFFLFSILRSYSLRSIRSSYPVTTTGSR